jgi:PAS domain S-box-containing protein
MLPNESECSARVTSVRLGARIGTPLRSAVWSVAFRRASNMPSAHGVKVRRTRDRSRKKYSPPAKKALPELIGARGVGPLGVAQQALAQMRESVVITDTEMKEPGPRIVYVNKAFTRLTGYLPKEVIGKNPGILEGPNTKSCTIERLRTQLEDGKSFEGEDIAYRKDGSEFCMEWYFEPLRDEKGRIAYFVAVQRDVTNERRREAERLRTQRLEGIGTLARSIAHDLNNVLTPILMGSDLLERKINDPDTTQLVAMLDRSVDRGAGLVKQLLTLARGLTGTGKTKARDGGGRSILIIDDEVAITEILKEILTSAGYKVATAASTSEGLGCAEETEPEAILLALRMARSMNNALLLELRARFPEAALIVMSELPRDAIPDIVEKTSAVLQKPFTVENLFVAVHDVLVPTVIGVD